MHNGPIPPTSIAPAESTLAPAGEATLPATADAGAAVPPLAVSGLVVAKADLIAALRLYVPPLLDIEPLDGEGFLLRLPGAGAGQAAEQQSRAAR